MKKRIKIIAKVTAQVEVEDGEDITQRMVDIYLHGEGEYGSQDKWDLGADNFTIIEIDADGDADGMYLDDSNTWRMPCGCSEASVLDGNHNVCRKGAVIAALIDTAERMTDMESVYNDKLKSDHPEHSFTWEEVHKICGV